MAEEKKTKAPLIIAVVATLVVFGAIFLYFGFLHKSGKIENCISTSMIVGKAPSEVYIDGELYGEIHYIRTNTACFAVLTGGRDLALAWIPCDNVPGFSECAQKPQ